METAAHAGIERRSLVNLFADLLRETTTLVHQEVQLAKAEMSEKVTDISSGLVAMAIAGAVLFAGFLVLLGAIVGAIYLAMSTEHRVWIAPLTVGVVVLVIGFITLAAGRRQLTARHLAPDRTLDSLRRNAELVKGHLQ
jgi:hypothetical protein